MESTKLLEDPVNDHWVLRLTEEAEGVIDHDPLLAIGARVNLYRFTSPGMATLDQHHRTLVEALRPIIGDRADLISPISLPDVLEAVSSTLEPYGLIEVFHATQGETKYHAARVAWHIYEAHAALAGLINGFLTQGLVTEWMSDIHPEDNSEEILQVKLAPVCEQLDALLTDWEDAMTDSQDFCESMWLYLTDLQGLLGEGYGAINPWMARQGDLIKHILAEV